jgi:hypothetical protein
MMENYAPIGMGLAIIIYTILMMRGRKEDQ